LDLLDDEPKFIHIGLGLIRCHLPSFFLLSLVNYRMVGSAADATNNEVLLMIYRVNPRGIGSIFHLQILITRSLIHGCVNVFFLLVGVVDEAAVVNVE